MAQANDCIEINQDYASGRLPAVSALARALLRLPYGLVLAAAFALLDWQRRSRERQHALGLGDRELKDVGLSRADLMRGR